MRGLKNCHDNKRKQVLNGREKRSMILKNYGSGHLMSAMEKLYKLLWLYFHLQHIDYFRKP